MAVEAYVGEGLGEDDTNGDENGSGARSERDGDFGASAFGILVAAAETESALGEIFADGDLFLKAAAANAGEDAGFDAGLGAARVDALFFGRLGRGAFLSRRRLRFDPDGRGVAMGAEAGDALANLERFELKLVEINDFAALAEAALHEQAGEGVLGGVRGGEVDAPKIVARIKEHKGVEEAFVVAIEFGEDAGTRGFPAVGVGEAAKREFLPGGDFFCEAKDAAVAADEQGLRGLIVCLARCVDPGGVDGKAQADAIAFAKTFGAHGLVCLKKRHGSG